MFRILSILTLAVVVATLYGQEEYDYDPRYDPHAWSHCGSSTHVDVEFLWLRTCPDGMYVAAKEEDRVEEKNKAKTALVGFQRKVDAESFDPHFSPGVRLRVGYQPAPNCCWDARLSWTYLSPSYDKSVRADVTEKDEKGVIQVIKTRRLSPFQSVSVFDNMSDLLGQTNPTSSINKIEKVKGDWDLMLSVIDLELGRKFWVGSCFLLRPNVALRFASIDQSLRIRQEGTLAWNNITADYTIKEHFKNQFTGLGPRVAMDAFWDIGCGAGLYGTGALSLVFGDRDAYTQVEGIRTNTKVNRQAATDQDLPKNPDGNPIPFTIHDKNKKNCSRPMTDLDIGLYWTTCIGRGRYDVMIKLGWEHHYFFNQGVADAGAGYTLLAKEESGALSSQGLRLSAGMTF